ncbi:MAG TPA: hypothetical protein VNL37_08730 [Candidatus Polarisedimenticolia bacterium]|nr:hypothetical protein [Candidatus Polarisedimenticolia bacterium]
MLDTASRGTLTTPPRGAPGAALIDHEHDRTPERDLLSRKALRFRRLRYFHSLLEAGYRSALRPDPLPRSLRPERIALGIDLPELDTVPLWAARRDDGTISIPFVEYILGQIGGLLADFERELGPMPVRDAAELVENRRKLCRVLVTLDPGGESARELPRLSDLFLSEATLRDLCGPAGLMERIVTQCEDLLAVEAED